MANPNKLKDSQKRAIFKKLANKSQYKVGEEFEFDKYYTDKNGNPKNISIINKVRSVYNEVKDNPDKFGVSQQMIEMVDDGMQERKNQRNRAVQINDEELAKVDEKELMEAIKSKNLTLIDEKLSYIANNKKEFKDMSLFQLVKSYGTLFDKYQIMSGKATEHISMKAEIKEDMTSEEAEDELLKMREVIVQENE